MSPHYTALQNPSATLDRELEASFDAEDSDEEDNHKVEESRPINRSDPSSRSSLDSHSGPVPYNFENLDYDYPPPGSPPRPSAFALPNNNIGNSNGQLPQSPQLPSPRPTGWIRRTVAAIIPNHFLRTTTSSGRIVGGGIENDGVFANINAKPVRGHVVDGGESGIHVVPEEVQKDAPPSYASAQADAVPPYWETTILTPATLGGAGEMMVEGMPTGSLFSFLWNFLVSMSFQFVGFLLTFLLHSTHAAKLGSRAGLGVTLINYGFYIRARATYGDKGGFLADFDDESLWNWPTSTAPNPPRPTFSTAAEAEGFYKNGMGLNKTAQFMSSYPPMTLKPVLSEGTAEWLSFLLMTIGWFILLTSTLSFWRIKRWERSIISSTPAEAPPDAAASHAHHPFHALERFGFPGAMWHSVNFGLIPRTDPGHDEEAAIESNGEYHLMGHSDTPEAIEQTAYTYISHVRATELRMQPELSTVGLP